VIIEISIQCVSERLLGLGRVASEKPDLDEEIDFAFAQLDRRAAKSAPSTIERPICALRRGREAFGWPRLLAMARTDRWGWWRCR
jgi:hypothetical protein